MRLYHYTSLESFWKIWVSQMLIFANSHVPSNNDYFERKKSLYINENECENFIEDILVNSSKSKIPNAFYQLNRYKQISFTKDYEKEQYGFDCLGCLSPMMWGQYADKGRGVCMELDSDALDIKPGIIWAGSITYVDNPNSFTMTSEDLKSEDAINEAISNQRDTIFFQKSIHWKAENEFRLVSKDVSELKIFNAIRKIIVPRYDGRITSLVCDLVGRQDLIYCLTTNEGNGVKNLNIIPLPMPEKS